MKRKRIKHDSGMRLELVGGPYDGAEVVMKHSNATAFFAVWRDKMAAYARFDDSNKFLFVTYLPQEEQPDDSDGQIQPEG